MISLGRSGDSNTKVSSQCFTYGNFTLRWCLGGLLCYLRLHSWLWRASAGEQGLGPSEHGQCQHQAGGTGDWQVVESHMMMVMMIFMMMMLVMMMIVMMMMVVPQSMGNANTRQEGQVVDWIWGAGVVFFQLVFFRWLVNRKYLGCWESQSRPPVWLPKIGEIRFLSNGQLNILCLREDNLIWFSRDVPALAKKLRTLPIIFDLDLASSQQAAQLGNNSKSKVYVDSIFLSQVVLLEVRLEYLWPTITPNTCSPGGPSVLSRQFFGSRNLCSKIFVTPVYYILWFYIIEPWNIIGRVPLPCCDYNLVVI